MQGHWIDLTVQYIYFLIGLPPLRMVGNTRAVLPQGQNIMEFVEHNFQLGIHVKGTRINVRDLEKLETHVVAIVVLRILGNQAIRTGSPTSCETGLILYIFYYN